MSIPVSPSPTLMPVESSASAVSLKSIIAGALAASAITLILTLIGSGLGLTMVSPWSGESASLEAIGWTTAVWLVLVQWLSAAFGGYLTGHFGRRLDPAKARLVITCLNAVIVALIFWRQYG